MSDLADWLRKQPQPASVTVGQQKCVVPTGRKRWMQLVETIESTAKPGDRVVALDADNAVLRAVVYDGEGGVEVSEDTTKKQVVESELVTFARILAESNDKAVARYEGMFTTVFAAQNSMLTTFASRLSSLENMWHKQAVELAKSQASIIHLAAERDAAQTPDLMETTVGTMITGMLTAGANGAANGATNGSAKKGKA